MKLQEEVRLFAPCIRSQSNALCAIVIDQQLFIVPFAKSAVAGLHTPVSADCFPMPLRLLLTFPGIG